MVICFLNALKMSSKKKRNENKEGNNRGVTRS